MAFFGQSRGSVRLALTPILMVACTLAAFAGEARSQAIVSSWAIGDFNGDHKADWVSASANREGRDYELVFHSGQPPKWTQISRSVFQPQRLSVSDIDGDNDADLVLESLSAQPLAVWLNDGNGNFARGDLKDYPDLRAPRDPKRCTSDIAQTSPEQSYEEAGSYLLAPGPGDFAPLLASAPFAANYKTGRGSPAAGGICARGPPLP